MENVKSRLVKNMLSNWAGTVIGAAIALLMAPFLVHTLGKDEYGVWVLIFSIVSYTNFFDAGMKQSLARYFPKYYGTGDYENLNKSINSSLLIYVITGTLVVGVTLIISFFFLDLFKQPPGLLPAMKISLIFVGFNNATYFFFMPIAALGPFHRYDLLNSIEITKSIVVALLIYYFVINGYGIVAMGAITFTTSLIAFIIRRIVQQRLVPQIEINRKYVDREQIRNLVNYGGISFFIVIAWLIIFNTSNILIGMFISTAAVTIYSIAGTLINYLRVIITAIGTPLVPTVSHLESTSQFEEINKIYKKSTRYLFFLSASICLGMFFFVDDFINLWMGPGFQETIEILYILIIPASIYLPQIMANSILLGIGKHKSLLIILIIEAISNIILSLILIRYYGIFGVAMGTIIPQSIIYIFIFPIIFHRIIKADIKQFYIQNTKIILYCIIVIAPIGYLLNQYLTFDNWLGFIFKVFIVGLFGLGLFWFKIIEDDDKLRVLRKIKKQ